MQQEIKTFVFSCFCYLNECQRVVTVEKNYNKRSKLLSLIKSSLGFLVLVGSLHCTASVVLHTGILFPAEETVRLERRRSSSTHRSCQSIVLKNEESPERPLKTTRHRRASSHCPDEVARAQTVIVLGREAAAAAICALSSWIRVSSAPGSESESPWYRVRDSDSDPPSAAVTATRIRIRDRIAVGGSPGSLKLAESGPGPEPPSSTRLRRYRWAWADQTPQHKSKQLRGAAGSPPSADRPCRLPAGPIAGRPGTGGHPAATSAAQRCRRPCRNLRP